MLLNCFDFVSNYIFNILMSVNTFALCSNTLRDNYNEPNFRKVIHKVLICPSLSCLQTNAFESLAYSLSLSLPFYLSLFRSLLCSNFLSAKTPFVSLFLRSCTPFGFIISLLNSSIPLFRLKTFLSSFLFSLLLLPSAHLLSI